MKVGDVVLFRENDVDYPATVLEVRELDGHYGENGQPLLQLGFFKPLFLPNAKGEKTRVNVVGTHRQDQLAQFRIDVAHESHEFEDPKLGRYPGGRWREAVITEVNANDSFQDGTGGEFDPNRDLLSDGHEAQSDSGQQQNSGSGTDDEDDDLQRTDPNTGLVDPSAPGPADTDQSESTTNLNGTEGDSSIQSEK